MTAPTRKEIIARGRDRAHLNTDWLAETVRYWAPAAPEYVELPAQVFRDYETGERLPGANVQPVWTEDHGRRVMAYAIVELASELDIHTDGILEIQDDNGQWAKWSIVRRNESDSGLGAYAGGMTAWLCERTSLGTTRRTRPRVG